MSACLRRGCIEFVPDPTTVRAERVMLALVIVDVRAAFGMSQEAAAGTASLSRAALDAQAAGFCSVVCRTAADCRCRAPAPTDPTCPTHAALARAEAEFPRRPL